MSNKILAIINPESGDSSTTDHLDRLRSKLNENFDTVHIELTKSEADVIDLADNACQEGYTAVCAFGGDGTVNSVINRLRLVQNPPKLCILPGGTGNILAQTLGIPANKKQAIEKLTFDKTQALDVGIVGDQCFSFFFSIGTIPEAVHDASSEMKKQFGIFAYFLSSTKALSEAQPYKLRVKTDSGKFEGSVDHLVVSMTNKYGRLKFSDVASDFDDGYCHLYVLKDKNIGQKASTVFNILGGNIEENDTIVHLKAKKILIENLDQDRDVETDLDGDKGPLLPVEIEILKGKIEVYL